MDELEKGIVGKWLDIKERARDIHAINEYFQFPINTLKQEIQKLSSSIELGIIEYKRTIVNSLFRTLGNVKYKTLNLDNINKLVSLAAILLYMCLLQRLIVSGIIKIDKDKVDDKIDTETLEISSILKDVLNRIKENPELKKNTAIKNILLQFTIYNNEKGTLKKLSSSMKEKSDNFYQNFKAVFEKIFASIRKNYADILKAEAVQFHKPNILVALRDKKLMSIILSQVKEITTIYATLEFAHNEKYKTREILVNLYNSRNKIYEYIEQEMKFYKEFTKDKTEKDKIISTICNNFSKEIVNLITKQIQ